MKNVTLLLVLLLAVNCTADIPNVTETSELLNQETENCVDDLPKVRITNNGSHNFDIVIYGTDYSQLHSQFIPTTDDSGWVEMTNNNVVIVASNSFDYGQKVQLSLQACDNIEVEIDANDTLIVN